MRVIWDKIRQVHNSKQPLYADSLVFISSYLQSARHLIKFKLSSHLADDMSNKQYIKAISCLIWFIEKLAQCCRFECDIVIQKAISKKNQGIIP